MVVTPAMRFDVFRASGFRCQYCGRPAPEVVLHVDHVVPVAKGGTNDPDNLVAACADCNLGKRASLIEDGALNPPPRP